jgi:hypothetical protein
MAVPALCDDHIGPISAKATVESQLAAWAIVGVEHMIVNDQANTATHTTPIAIRTSFFCRIASLLVARLVLQRISHQSEDIPPAELAPASDTFRRRQS